MTQTVISTNASGVGLGIGAKARNYGVATSYDKFG